MLTTGPGTGKPLPVVLDGTGLDGEALARFARWANLSRTTFALPPDDPAADYRVRIFSPDAELPFAGHPTLGSCHAWLEAGGAPRDPGRIVPECGVGRIAIRRAGDTLALAAPPVPRSGPVDEADLVAIAAAVLAVQPGAVDRDLGVIGLHPPGCHVALEARAPDPQNGLVVEDPVKGSLNASAAGWLLSTGRLTAPCVEAQGTAIGRAGRIEITRDADGTVWKARCGRPAGPRP